MQTFCANIQYPLNPILINKSTHSKLTIYVHQIRKIFLVLLVQNGVPSKLLLINCCRGEQCSLQRSTENQMKIVVRSNWSQNVDPRVSVARHISIPRMVVVVSVVFGYQHGFA